MALNIPAALVQYQQRRRRQSEDKVILHLIRSAELCGPRQIWLKTRIYKNNVRPILDKLVEEKKIIRVDDIRHEEYYTDLRKNLHKRIVTRTIYLPNLKNHYVFDLLKEKLPHFFYGPNRKWVRKGTRLFLSWYEKKYKEISIEKAFAIERGNFVGYDELKGVDELEIIYVDSVGKGLLAILNMLKLLPKKAPSIKYLDKKLKKK